jgi:hypothetical protein
MSALDAGIRRDTVQPSRHGCVRGELADERVSTDDISETSSRVRQRTEKSGRPTMSDQPFYAPNRAPATRRKPMPGERLFEFLRGHDRYLCELRDHGEVYGVEAQFYQNEEFTYSRRFETRALAVQWAEKERTYIEAGGA